MFNYVPIKHKQMSFASNGGKFKLYTVLNGLFFPTPTQPRISFERAISKIILVKGGHGFSNNCRSICVNYFLNVKICQTLIFYFFPHFAVELSRPEICHLVGEICADKSLKLLKKQLNGNFYLSPVTEKIS
jgi:hypothetical protein